MHPHLAALPFLQLLHTTKSPNNHKLLLSYGGQPKGTDEKQEWGSHLIFIWDSNIFLRTRQCTKAELPCSLYTSRLVRVKQLQHAWACASHGLFPSLPPSFFPRGLPVGFARVWPCRGEMRVQCRKACCLLLGKAESQTMLGYLKTSMPASSTQRLQHEAALWPWLKREPVLGTDAYGHSTTFQAGSASLGSFAVGHDTHIPPGPLCVNPRTWGQGLKHPQSAPGRLSALSRCLSPARTG